VRLKDGLQCLLIILGGVRLEQVGTDGMMHGISLIQQGYKPLDVSFFSSSNHFLFYLGVITVFDCGNFQAALAAITSDN